MPVDATNKFTVAAIAMILGGVMIGVVMPMLFLVLGIKSVEIAPDFDLLTVLLPGVGLVDFVMAWFFWRLGKPAESHDGPVVG